MILVKEEAKLCEYCDFCGNHFSDTDTIEISDAQLNKIYHHYNRCQPDYSDFADCLRKSLISLTGEGA